MVPTRKSNDIDREPSALIDPFARDRLSAYLDDGSLRLPLRLLHVRGHAFLPKRDLLTLEELDRLCGVFIERGARKLRITGGEPLVRRDILHLFPKQGTPVSPR